MAMDWGVGHYERTAEMLRPAAEALVEAAGVRPGEKALDVGCGTGNVALLAAEAGAHVTALDPSPRLLTVAAATAEQRGLSITCTLGEAASIPAADGAFDCLLSNFGVIFASDPGAAVNEMARVLVPGGRVALTSWLPGGAVGAMASTAEQLVRAAAGAPPAGSGFAWHDSSALAALFAPHDMAITIEGPHDLVFTAASPEEYLDAEMTNHPMAVTAFEVLRQHGQSQPAREKLLEVLRAQNEDPTAFRSTSRYIVVLAGRS